MKTINTRKALLGLGLLGATTLAGLTSPASAAPGRRYEVRQDRQDVREARRDVREAKRDLRDEKRDLRNTQRHTNAPFLTRPNFQNNTFRTLEGVVTKDTAGDDFDLRTNNGQQVRVYVRGGESGAISRGDIVRVSGNFSNGVFYTQRTNIIRNR